MNRQTLVLLVGLVAAMSMDKVLAVSDEFIKEIEHAKSLAVQKKLPEAIQYWEQKRSRYAKTDGYYEYELATFYSSARRFKDAERMYQEGHTINPRIEKFNIALAFLYLEQNKIAEAVKWANRAITEYPLDPSGHATLGEIERRQGNNTAARDHLKASLRVSPTAHTAWLMSIVSYELKEYEAAVQSMEMAVNLNRSYAGDKDGMIVAAVSLANLGRFQDAYGALDTLKDNNKNITVAEIDNVRREIAKVQKSKLKQTQ